MTRGTIVIAGSLAQKPGRGGHAWVFLQYLLGFRRLGWDVLFLDAMASDACVDADGAGAAPERSVNLTYLRDVMSRAGLADSWAIVVDRTGIYGARRDHVLARLKQSAMLLNINGFLRDDDLLAAAPRRVFLDIDPGVFQIWHALGLHHAFVGHDHYATIGQHLGTPECPIPPCGIEWIPTPPPVVLQEWPVAAASRPAVFTSVASWRGAFAPLEYGGVTYGQRVHEFRKFIDLPRRSAATFELALDIHPADARDRSLLISNEWTLVDPLTIGADPWTYRKYVQHSAAEFMVAKGIYAATRCGWVSDRSVCYLASGKPVIAQDTGLANLYPIGNGLISFTTVDEAADAVRRVLGDYDRHATAARSLAHEHFDSDVVLPRLLARVGVS